MLIRVHARVGFRHELFCGLAGDVQTETETDRYRSVANAVVAVPLLHLLVDSPSDDLRPRLVGFRQDNQKFVAAVTDYKIRTSNARTENASHLRQNIVTH